MQAALIGAVATAGAALFGVLAVVAQIRSQGRQSRAAIEQTERRKIKAKLYEDSVATCREVADAAIALATRLRSMNLELEVAANADALRLGFNPPPTRFLALNAQYGVFSDAVLRFVFLVEDRRIVDPRILIFRTAMSALLHDSRQIMQRDFVVHVMPILPAEQPDGTLFPYAAPTKESVAAAVQFSNRLIDALDDAVAYTEDFLVEMQNALLGDLFGTWLPSREPIDPNRRAVSLDHASELEQWFRDNTAWGAEMARIERETKGRFLNNEADSPA